MFIHFPFLKSAQTNFNVKGSVRNKQFRAKMDDVARVKKLEEQIAKQVLKL